MKTGFVMFHGSFIHLFIAGKDNGHNKIKSHNFESQSRPEMLVVPA